MSKGPPAPDVFESIESFLDENPDIAEALQIFEMSRDEYNRALAALLPALQASSNTTGGAPGRRGPVDRS
jgi:outer membrane protein TolC